ncbi:unnamed protein product [Phytophthora lilii]|uniref:Unnamed protein product n=1 Tax=Phytophthora lilii TaxID=2077276 RepID=A0A9W6YDU7_9STRA|nr:unnamed protein product [Phytophthora lilii]
MEAPAKMPASPVAASCASASASTPIEKQSPGGKQVRCAPRRPRFFRVTGPTALPTPEPAESSTSYHEQQAITATHLSERETYSHVEDKQTAIYLIPEGQIKSLSSCLCVDRPFYSVQDDVMDVAISEEPLAPVEARAG